MERVVFYLRIFPGTEAEYDRRHAEIWPELVEEIRSFGIRSMTGFRRGTDVWYYCECEPDAKTAFGIQDPSPPTSAGTTTSARDRPDHRRFRRAALVRPHLLRRRAQPEGPMQRALLSLVIDPERSDDYEALARIRGRT